MSDIVVNMDQYFSMQQANPHQAFTMAVVSAYMAIAIGNTVSDTTNFSDFKEDAV